MTEDDSDDLNNTFFNPDKEGWLWKQGGRYRSWKRRWFILSGKCLYYFEFTTVSNMTYIHVTVTICHVNHVLN